eukprot:jgi/Tetstr1/421284/TSEL_001157.t1
MGFFAFQSPGGAWARAERVAPSSRRWSRTEAPTRRGVAVVEIVWRPRWRRCRPDVAMPQWQRSVRCHALPIDPLSVMCFVPQVCFTQECQERADREFLLAIVPGLMLAAGLLVALFRPAPTGGRFFQDPSSQIVFEAPEKGDVGRDAKGELIYKVVSYTPYPCQSDVKGERIRIDVGPVGSREPRTFVFEKLLPHPSKLIKVTLPRPLGIVFEEDERRQRVVVGSFVEGGLAEQEYKRAKLDRSREEGTALLGDVLRAITCTTLIYAPASMFGAAAPIPTISVYSADQQKWPKVVTALKRGSVADGEVTLILERRRQD